MELIEQRDPVVPLAPACDALGLSRAAVYRHKAPRKHGPRRRPSSPRKLAGDERAKVLAELHSERFADQTPSEVYGTLLEEGAYHCSVRTMYRVLAEQGETRERRDQRPPAHHAVPRLEASRPNSVWTWDITKLPTHVRGVFLNLYVVLDLYSRYVVAWMVAERENSALAKQLFAEAIECCRARETA
ncbi:MAG: DDE-type integrase/transposase/recombinase [Polyangiales bacterium]